MQYELVSIIAWDSVYHKASNLCKYFVWSMAHIKFIIFLCLLQDAKRLEKFDEKLLSDKRDIIVKISVISVFSIDSKHLKTNVLLTVLW